MSKDANKVWLIWIIAASFLRKADAIFIYDIRQHDLYHKTSQAFSVFLPVKSVGLLVIIVNTNL